MGEVYPELTAKAGYIREVTETEEQRFLETIEGGLRRLEEIFASGARVIPGEEAFKLYDTFGFPIDLTEIIAEERGVEVDTAGFERALKAQQERSRDRADRGQDGRRRPGGAHVAEPASGGASSAASRSSSATRPPRPTPTSWPSGRRGRGWSWCCARTRSTPSRADR